MFVFVVRVEVGYNPIMHKTEPQKLVFLAFLVGSMHKTQPQPQKQTHLHLVIAFLRIDHLFKFKLLLLLIIILHLGLGQLPPLHINLVLKVETLKPELEVICEFLK